MERQSEKTSIEKVLELAAQNVLEEKYADTPRLQEERKEQQAAVNSIRSVADYSDNSYVVGLSDERKEKAEENIAPGESVPVYLEFLISQGLSDSEEEERENTEEEMRNASIGGSATLEDLREGKAILDMIIDNESDMEAAGRMVQAGYSPESAKKIVKAARTLLTHANQLES
jgi:hypothetical protein